ncbi:MAG: AraC family transcriptional regulator [Ferruginibacter sp.]
MKPKLEQLLNRINHHSFIGYEVIVPAFEFLWHYHPEYELTYIVKGKGKRLVGDQYELFQEGDWVLLPPMLPHTWISEKKAKEKCHAIVIQFSKEFAEKLFQFSALKNIETLFSKCSRGLYFKSTNNGTLILLQSLLMENALTRFTLLLQVFNQLALLKAFPIASIQYKPVKGDENQQRINSVFLFVQKNFKDTITLKKAASLIHLSESAFCKFFKRASGQTFSNYINEIRIAHACHLLMETDLPISAIAFESGFESLTYFNRVFLKKKKITPSLYRKN